MTPDSAEYAITETLREGGGTCGLYRAVRLRDRAPVILERLHFEVPAPGELERLRHEYAIGRQLASRFVLRPLELETRGAPPRLVLEDFDGELLSRRLGQPFALEDFFAVAIPLAAALSDLHRRGVVHNAVSPDSILVHRSTEALRLIDLGNASPLVRASFLSMSARAVGGDPVYLSPEQMGRMSRGVDHRSDLYSLGLVSYVMLTGALPFQAADALGWVHCHLAQAPRPPLELVPSIPEVLADLVLDGVLERTQGAVDRARVYGLKLTAYPMAGRYDDAVAMGTCALQLLGEALPQDDESLVRAIEAEARAVKAQLEGRAISELAATPEATDPRVKAVAHLLTAMAGPTYIGSRPQLYPLLALKSLRAFLQHGATKSGIHGFSAYAVLLMCGFGDPRDGHAFSQVALELAERFGDRGVLGDALYMHGNHINFWLEPIATDFPILERGFRACLDAGNLVFANYIAYAIVWQAIERGDALGDVVEFSRRYASFALGSRNVAIHQTIVLEQQFLKCLMGETEGPGSFSDAGTSEASCLERATTFTCGVAYYHVMKALVAHLLGDAGAARTHADEAKRVLPAVAAQPMEATFCFLHALVLLRACGEAGEEPARLLREVRAYQKKLAAWAARCPANFAAKHLLVSARLAEHDGDELLAERLFERAIESARESGFIHWEAMAHEEAAAFHERRGLGTMSRAYRREALRCYARWGAVAKVRQLEDSNPWLVEKPPVERGSAGARFDQLDLESIIKAQHAISAEVDLDRLAEALLRIVMESAGAQVGFLSVEGAGEVRAEVRPERGGGERVRIVGPSASGVPYADVPESIVNYVRRSHRAVLLDDAGARAGDFVADDYLQRVRPKSVLCVAIQRQEKLLGVLYLENNLVAGAFTPERRFIIEALAAQAAISLETAGLYQALQASEERLRLTLEAAQIGVFDWDVSKDLWSGSRVYDTMLGYPPKSEPGHREEWLARVHPDDRQLVETKIQAVLTGTSSAESYEYEARLRHADGAYRWQHVKGFGIERDGAGRTTRVLGVRMDITARKAAEEELAQHRDHLEELVRLRTAELESANTELEAFAYSVSHDLRAPLRHIEGFIGLLEKRLAGTLDEQGRLYMRTITTSSQRAQLLIADLLSFSRMTRAEMVTSRVDLRELAQEVLQEAGRDAGGRDVAWEVAPLPVVTGDRAMLRVVLVNLIANALKFTRTRSPARIELGCEEGDGDETVVFVRDNGVGFDMRYADRLFGVFQRLHREEDFEGTGIGLAIVRRIISRHGGRAWATGVVDQGATFSFSLPRRNQTSDDSSNAGTRGGLRG